MISLAQVIASFSTASKPSSSISLCPCLVVHRRERRRNTVAWQRLALSQPYDRVITLLRSHGISPLIVQEGTPMTTLTGLVAAGAGMGFVSDGIATVVRPGVVFRSVEPEPPDLPFAAAWRSPDLSSPAARFLDIVTAHRPRVWVETGSSTYSI
jgi:DNA-binding transcriptional LysR family regulator